MDIFMNKFYRFSEWVMHLALLQLYWVLGTLVGGVVLGIVPATIALFASIRYLYMGNKDLSLYACYIKAYKTNFKASFLLGTYFIVAALIGYSYKLFIEHTSQSVLAYTHIALYMILFFGILVILFLIPVYIHYEIPTKRLLRTTFSIIATNLKWCAPLLLSLIAVALIFIRYSVVFLFFGMSLPCFVILYFCMQAFADFDLKRELI